MDDEDDAGDPSNDDDDDDDDSRRRPRAIPRRRHHHPRGSNHAEERRLQEFFRHLGQASRSPAVIDEIRARNILEICQGDVQLAGQLYWDDYLASQAAEQEDEDPPQVQAAAAAAPGDEADPFQEGAVAWAASSRRGRVCRRLDEDFEEQLRRRDDVAAAPNDDNNNNNAEEARRNSHRVGLEAAGPAHRPFRRSNRSGRRRQLQRQQVQAQQQQPPAELGIQNVLVAAQAVAAIAVQRNPLLRDPAVESVSVSDDEKAGGVLRMVRDRGLELNAALQQQRGENDNHGDDDDEDERGDAPSNNNDAPVRNANHDEMNSDNARASSSSNNPEDSVRVERRRRAAAAALKRSKQQDAMDKDQDDDQKPKSRPSSPPPKDDDDEEDEDAYLSDHDWIWNSTNTTVTLTTTPGASQNQPTRRPPLALLWGGALPPPAVPAVAGTENIKSEEKESGQKRKRQFGFARKKNKRAKLSAAGSGGDGGGGDDDGDDDDNDNDGADDSNSNNRNDDKENDREQKESISNRNNKAGGHMPFTWMHASFTLDAEGQGLALKPPTPEALMDHTNMWKRWEGINDGGSANGNNNNNNSVPLPFHCRSVTAILSVVTALFHTGATLQAGHISCTSARPPFVELTPEQRKREFESRLADALSVLIFIAIKASVDRKNRVLRKRLNNKQGQGHKKTPKKKVRLVYGTLLSDVDAADVVAGDKDELQQKLLARKLRLWPTTWWEDPPWEQLQRDDDEDTANNNNKPLPPIQLGTSYTHVGDIRSHMLSNMRSFTSPGGLALLLETIVSIHGSSAVAHMMRKSQQQKQSQSATAGVAASAENESKMEDGGVNPFLICCCCKERQQMRLETMPPAARRKMASSLDTTPPGHDCFSVELLSLLLTGRIHSTLRGWSTGNLGFGMLTDKPGEVGHELARPDKPVWILRGATQYSVMYLNETNSAESQSQESRRGNASVSAMSKADLMASCSTSRYRDQKEATAFSKQDHPGFIATLTHWNCWHGLRNKSGLRLIAERPQWTPPSPSKVVASYRDAANNNQDCLAWNRKSVAQRLQERRKQQKGDVASDEHEIAEPDEKLMSNLADEEAMDRVKIHPEDKSFYPKQYRMWRYDMGEDQNRRLSMSSSASSRTERWTPYFGLSRQEQLIVEMKLGPQINRILWTRWPRATIDKFSPEGRNEPPPVV